MIIRHDVDPQLYLTDPTQFPAIVAVDSFEQPVQIAYDQIDELLKPSLLPIGQGQPDTITRYDGMGTLIRPTWILTAAHVAVELSKGKEIKFISESYAIQRCVLHPQFENYSDNEEMASHDIALIELNRPVKGVEPLPLYGQCDELGKTVMFVGMGDFGNGLIGPDEVDGKMRKATNRIEGTDEQWLVFEFDTPPDCTELEGISGPGDSGGPALILMDEEEWAIAGVSSGNISRLPNGQNLGEGRYGTWEYYTRVSSYLGWIESVV